MAVYTTIDDPEAYFQPQLYTGNGAANNAITLGADTDMQPDFVWIKNRDATDAHCIFDAVRGATKVLVMATTDEATDTDTLDSFTSDGFQVDADVKVNTDTEKYVAWCWKANGTGSSNTDGTINTGATSANTTAGFSISTYTGTGSAATIGHGLSAVPHWVVHKKTDTAGSGNFGWYGHHVKLTDPGPDHLVMNTTASEGTSDSLFNDTGPTSSVTTVGTSIGVNESGIDYVMYCWTSIQGFSKFGSYTGNGNADGMFVYTGFKPALVMTKSNGSTSAWHIFDNKREGYNVDNDALESNATTVEATTDQIDLLSNGFKLRISSDPNVAEAYVYWAFAEAPFVNSNGIPCNAR